MYFGFTLYVCVFDMIFMIHAVCIICTMCLIIYRICDSVRILLVWQQWQHLL